MKKSQNTGNQNSQEINAETTAEVLYQKLGERWFAFSIIDEEVFMSPVEEDQIEQIKKERYGTA